MSIELTNEERIAHLLECVALLRRAGESTLEAIHALRRGNERQDREIAELRARLPQEPAPSPPEHPCSKCGKSVCNAVFTVCDECWPMPAPVEPAETPGGWRYFESGSGFLYRVRATGTDDVWVGHAWSQSNTPWPLVRFLGSTYSEILFDALPAEVRAAIEREQEPRGEEPSFLEIVEEMHPEEMAEAHARVASEAQAARIVALEAELAEARDLLVEWDRGNWTKDNATATRAFLSRRAAIEREQEPDPAARIEKLEAELAEARSTLEGLLAHVDRETCRHEETYRGGAIWEICDDCGEKWADDRGGRPEYKDPKPVAQARALLSRCAAPASEAV